MRLTNLLLSSVVAATAMGCSATTTGDGGVDQDAGVDDGGVDDMRRGANADSACAAVSATATLVKKPVDVIIVVDNSGSMTAEIQSVESNINTNFAQIIAASGLDYRVILLAKHGSASADQSICISMPLSGNATCTPPPATPTNTAKFFHYSTEIGSTNSLVKILSTYNVADPSGQSPTGWSAWLRPEAFKTFIEITDDNQNAGNKSFTDFDTELLALSPSNFGTASDRNYVFHTIGGVVENMPVTAPWQPSDPLQMTKCTGNGGDSVNPSLEYQKLSQLTGGLRFPICQYTNFDAVFQAVAQGVVQGAQVACQFEVPPPPDGQEVDLSTVSVLYTPSGGGGQQTFTQVADATACAGAQTFYIAAGQIQLCPDTCNAVTNDPTAQVEVYFDCLVPIN